MEREIFEKFVAQFNELKKAVAEGSVPEKAMFDLSKEFYSMTGGKLSQYNSPLAVGVAVVEVEKDGVKGFLGMKRGIPPFVGGVAFPGGFVNENESTVEAAVRELKEETNVDLPDIQLWEHVGEKKTPNNQLLIFYRYKNPVDFTVVENLYKEMEDKSENQGLVFLSESDEMCFSLHKEVLMEQSKTLQKNQSKKIKP